MSSAKLKRVLSKLQAEYGDDSFMTLDEVPLTGAISSGSLSLDYATGIGGLPDNRVVELAGANGAGKSTLAFRAIDNALEKNPDRFALYLDVEGRISREWAEKHITNHDRLFISQPTTAEEATDHYTGAVGTGDFCVAVFDSIGGALLRESRKSLQLSVTWAVTLLLLQGSQVLLRLTQTSTVA